MSNEKELINASEEKELMDTAEELKEETVKKEQNTETVQETGTENKSAKDKKERKPKRFQFLKGFFTGILVLFAAAVLYKGYLVFKLPGGGILNVTLPTYELTAKKEINGLNLRSVAKKLEEMNTILSEYALYDVDKKSMEEAIYTGMMYGVYLNDPYAAYFTNSGYKEEERESAGEYVGIGVVVQLDPENRGVKVIEVKEDSPALEAGIMADDLIIGVNDEDIRDKDLDTVVESMILGEAGSSVKLKVIRGGEELELVCERRRIETKTVVYEMLPGANLGHIKVNSFSGVTAEQFETAMHELEGEGARGLIIDLRDNLGGDMNITLNMLDSVLKDNIDTYTSEKQEWYEQGKTLLLTLEDRNHNKTSHQATDGFSCSLPIVVLINEHSASASEIFAGTLQSYGYPVVGVKSFGKGIVQATYQLADGSAMKFTVEQYLLPDGDAIHGKGIEPDFVVENIEGGEDDQLKKAKEILWDKVLNGDE